MGGGKLVSLVLFLLLLPLALAQTCDFYDLEPYIGMEMKLVYEDTNVVAADDLTSLQFTNITTGQINKTLFSVYNPNDFEVVAFFSYEVEGTGTLIRDSTNPSSITLPPKTTVESQPELCIDDALGISGPCGIKPETVMYSVRKRLPSGGLEPKTMRPKLAEISKKRPIPNKPCPNGNQDCFTNKCNRMGYCDTKVNVSCCRGKQLCNDYCSTPGSKNVGDAYNCDWECTTGFGDGKTCKLSNNLSCTLDSQCGSGVCNSDGYCGNICTEGKQICNSRYCRSPSLKKENEQYDCSWECNPATTSPSNGVCTLTPLEQVKRQMWGIFFALLLPSVVIVSFLSNRLNKAKVLNEQISNEKLQVDKKLSQIQSTNEALKKSIEDYENWFKKYTEPQKIPGRGGMMWRNPEKNLYPCYWNGEGKPNDKEIHRHIAETEIFNQNKVFFNKNYPGRYFSQLRVHHIDKNTDNFSPKNLVIVSKGQHPRDSSEYELGVRKIEHSNIINGDWESGIKELKRIGIKSPHIPELKD